MTSGRECVMMAIFLLASSHAYSTSHMLRDESNVTRPEPSKGQSPSLGLSPDDLPSIPDKLWFTWWGGKTGGHSGSASFKGPGTDYASVVMDPIPHDHEIDEYGDEHTRFLYPAFRTLADCDDDGSGDDMTGSCDLKDDYQDRWNKAVPKLTQFLKDKKILGFTLGDERICHGMDIDEWITMADTIRATFPRGTAIIYANECGSTFFCDDDESNGPCYKDKVPDSIDWISIDKYHKKIKDNVPFVDKLRSKYEQYIYPKLNSHQKVAVSPRVGCDSEARDCPDPDDSAENAKVELDDAHRFQSWQRNDPLIAMMSPYRLDDLVVADDADDLRDFWYKWGKSTK